MALGAIPLLSRDAYPLFWKAAIAIGVMTMSMLIHEASLFTSGPIFVWLLAGPTTRGVSLKNMSFAKAAAILAFVAILIATVYVIDSAGQSLLKKERICCREWSPKRRSCRFTITRMRIRCL